MTEIEAVRNRSMPGVIPLFTDSYKYHTTHAQVNTANHLENRDRRYGASTVIRIYSGIPFAWKYSNACAAARRLAAALVVSLPVPTMTVQTEVLVLQ